MRSIYSGILVLFLLQVDVVRGERFSLKRRQRRVAEREVENHKDETSETDAQRNLQDEDYWNIVFESATSMPSQAPVGMAQTEEPVTPTEEPTPLPTTSPSVKPSFAPIVGTRSPTTIPTPAPTRLTPSPTSSPSSSPTALPTAFPSPEPSAVPTICTPPPTNCPPPVPGTPQNTICTEPPSACPETNEPTQTPLPSANPTGTPTLNPTLNPTPAPSASPTQPPIVQQRLRPYLLQGGTEFDDPESYQSKALARTEEQMGIEGMDDAKIVQYYALYCLYNATNKVPNAITDADSRFDSLSDFPEWKTTSGWEENDLDPCSGWHGITCDNGKVTKIELDDNDMTGNFPHEVTLLASDGERTTGAGSLNTIDLFNNEFLFNNFDNSWMTFLGSNFENLYFQATAFAGDIPRLPTNLVELDCSYTFISGGLTDENFEGLNELTFALLSGNAYNSSVPQVFNELPNLEYFYIQDAFVSGDLSFMEGMPKIIELWIDVNEISGPVFPFLGDIDTLQSFSATENSLTGELPTELGDMDSLASLWLYDNLLTGQIPTELGDLSLVLLQLEGNAFTGTMPLEVCEDVGFLKPLAVLGADCNDDNFSCICCTCCSLAECNPGLFSP